MVMKTGRHTATTTRVMMPSIAVYRSHEKGEYSTPKINIGDPLFPPLAFVHFDHFNLMLRV